MYQITVLGVILIVLGVVALSYQGFTYTTREQVFKAGPIVAVQDKRVDAALMQFVIDGIRNRALATSGQTRKPQHGSLVAVQFGAFVLGHGVIMPRHVGGELFGHRQKSPGLNTGTVRV